MAFVASLPFTVNEGKVEIQSVCQGGCSSIAEPVVNFTVFTLLTRITLPLSTTSIGTDNDTIPPAWNLRLDVGHHDQLGEQVITRDIEETLNLRGMQIHGDNMIGSSYGEQIGDESITGIIGESGD